MTPATEEKAARILSTGRLKVGQLGEDTITAVCFAESEDILYEVTFGAGGWRCTCPARRECAHIRALRLVTVWNLRWPG